MITKEQALMSVRILDAGCSNNTERDIVNDATATILQFIEQQSASTSVQVPEGFTTWLCREMPEGTVIGDPKWWAEKITRAMLNQPQEG